MDYRFFLEFEIEFFKIYYYYPYKYYYLFVDI